MSIIHDALKKTQDKIKGNGTPVSPSPFLSASGPQSNPSSGQPTPTAKTGQNYNTKILIFLIVLTIVVIGSIISFFVKGPSTNTSNISSAPSAAPVVVSKNTPGDQNIDKLVKGLHFQGTASNGTSIAALINDDIYEEGDNINGLIVEAIRKNEIDLTAGGQQITLRIQ